MKNKVRFLVAALVGAVVTGAGLGPFPGAERLLAPGELVAQAVGLPSWGPYILVMLAVCFITYAGIALVLLSLVRRAL